MPIPLLENLNEASVEHLADLIEQGLKQLGELPNSRRESVRTELDRRIGEIAAAEATAEEAKAEKKAKKAAVKKPAKGKQATMNVPTKEDAGDASEE